MRATRKPKPKIIIGTRHEVVPYEYEYDRMILFIRRLLN